jgi:L-malate glycosyltransferase
MRILFVSAKRGWGGIVTQVYRTAEGLEARGHRAWIISHPRSPFTRLAPRTVRIIPKRLGMDFNPAIILYLARFIRREGVDLVVTNIQKEVLAGGIAARICGIPNVRIVGNEDDLTDKIKWRQVRLVDHTMVPSDATLVLASKRAEWLDPAKYTTIHIGVNPVTYAEAERDELRRAWGVPPQAMVIGSTSTLAEGKGLAGLISAFKAVCETCEGCRLVITGQGPDRARLEDLARRLGVSDRVVFAGFTTEPLRTAAAYDIAVLNSAIEGFPNVIVEYMAVSRPVVATDVGGIPEILRDGENGLVVRSGDDAQLVRKLRLLAGDPGLRQRLGRGAIDTVRKGFSRDIMVEKTEALFERVIAGRRG